MPDDKKFERKNLKRPLDKRPFYSGLLRRASLRIKIKCLTLTTDGNKKVINYKLSFIINSTF